MKHKLKGVHVSFEHAPLHFMVNMPQSHSSDTKMLTEVGEDGAEREERPHERGERGRYIKSSLSGSSLLSSSPPPMLLLVSPSLSLELPIGLPLLEVGGLGVTGG